MTDGATAGPQPAYRILADRLADQILAGRIRPGEALPPEVAFAATFGVHRSTVREGIRLLEETGMLRRRSPRRLVVSIPDRAHVAGRTAVALVLRQVSVRALYEATVAFDPVLARAAAANASGTQIAGLRRNLRATEAAAGDLARLARMDADFHDLLCEATNNEVFQTMRQPLHDLFLPMVSDLVRAIDTSGRMIAAHARIVAAIERRDGDEAALWARRHIEDFRRGCEKAGLDFDRPVTRGRAPAMPGGRA